MNPPSPRSFDAVYPPSSVSDAESGGLIGGLPAPGGHGPGIGVDCDSGGHEDGVQSSQRGRTAGGAMSPLHRHGPRTVRVAQRTPDVGKEALERVVGQLGIQSSDRALRQPRAHGEARLHVGRWLAALDRNDHGPQSHAGTNARYRNTRGRDSEAEIADSENRAVAALGMNNNKGARASCRLPHRPTSATLDQTQPPNCAPFHNAVRWPGRAPGVGAADTPSRAMYSSWFVSAGRAAFWGRLCALLLLLNGRLAWRHCSSTAEGVARGDLSTALGGRDRWGAGAWGENTIKTHHSVVQCGGRGIDCRGRLHRLLATRTSASARDGCSGLVAGERCCHRGSSGTTATLWDPMEGCHAALVQVAL